MSQLEWDGRHLGGDTLALAIHTDVSTADDASPLILAAASTGGGRNLIRPERIGAFLLGHREVLFVCFDAGSFFWAIADHLDRASDRASLEALWALPRTGRVHDVILLDQLVRLARGSPRPRAESLHSLSARHLGIEPAVDVHPSEVAGRRAVAVLSIYRVLCEEANALNRRLGIGTEVAAQWGPLSLNLQVKGAIASVASGRNGLQVDVGCRDRLTRACNAIRQASAERLWGYGEARRCFKQDHGEFKLTSTGFLAPREASLRGWLRSLGDTLTARHDIPATVPELPGDIGKIDPAEWGTWVRCHPALRAWSEHVEAASLRRYFDRLEGDVVRPEYEIVPSIRAVSPDLDALRRLIPDLVFRPNPNREFLVMTLDDLDLRALATVLERRFGQHSELARVFRDGRDPITYAATRLFGTDEAGLEAMAAEHPDHYLFLTRVAHALHFAVPRGLGEYNLREIAGTDFGVSLEGAEAHDLHRRIVDEVYPELDVYLNDDTFAVLAASLGTTPEECYGKLRLPESEGDFPLTDTTRPALRRIIRGQDPPGLTRGYREWRALTWERLRLLNRNPALTRLLERDGGSRELLAEVFRRDVVTLTGRVRAGLGYVEGLGCKYLDLADDALKAALLAVVADGHRMVAICGTAFVLEIPADADAEALISHVGSIACRAAEEALGAFPVACSGRRQARW